MVTYCVCCVALLACAAFLGLRWADLPDQIPVFITLFGEVTTSAPKTFWTVMRLPIMGLLTVGIIAVAHVIASKGTTQGPEREKIRMFFLGALTALAFKMAPNALSIKYVADGRLRGSGLVLHYLATLMAVLGVVIILIALLQLRKTSLPWPNTRQRWWLTLLSALCGAYAAAVFAPLT